MYGIERTKSECFLEFSNQTVELIFGVNMNIQITITNIVVCEFTQNNFQE